MMKNIAVCFKQSYDIWFFIGPLQLHFSLMNSNLLLFSPVTMSKTCFEFEVHPRLLESCK